MASFVKSVCILALICAVQSIDSHDQCYSCISTEDGYACAFPSPASNKCSVFSEVFSTNRCYTKTIDGNLIRGCIGDKFVPELAQCKDGNCEACTAANTPCNDKQISDTCIQCESSDPHSKCKKYPGSERSVFCSLNNKISSGCYLKVNNETYKRGCVEHLRTDEKEQCSDSDENWKCKTCSYPNCNQRAVFELYCGKCDGSKETGCAQASTISSDFCIPFSESCVTSIDKNGHTHRGCASYEDLVSNKFPGYPNLYSMCYTKYCNRYTFPADRLRCFQCSGSDCDDSSAKACNSFYNESCYGYLTKGISRAIRLNFNLFSNGFFFCR